MTDKQFFDWQTGGGTDDVMRLVDCLERANIQWCAIDGISVNHWAEEPMVTQDVDFVVAAENIDSCVKALEAEGFTAKRFEWSVNFKGKSKVSLQLSTEDVYLSYPERSVPADVHGILMRVASAPDTLHGKILAWADSSRRQSKRVKDLADIIRLIEAKPELYADLPDELKEQVDEPS